MSSEQKFVRHELLLHRGQQLFLLYQYICGELERILHRQGPEVFLRFLSDTCRLWRFHRHPGVFADGRLENALLGLASQVSSATELEIAFPEMLKAKNETVLHVISDVPEFGGHVRALLNWIEADAAHCHLIVLTGMTGNPPPATFINQLAAQQAVLVQLPAQASWFDRAWTLRQISREMANLVVLHHHPEDPLPTLAFAASDVPPVAVFNHADHLFWLGASVADVIVDHRAYGARISKGRRFARSTSLLPLPLVPSDSAISRTEARHRLGIANSEVVLLTVAAHYKCVPNERYNFFRTLNRVLECTPKARLFVVGVQSEMLPEEAKQYLHERMQLVSPQSDISLYMRAADIAVESMPYGSSTALLECILAGAAPFPLYAPQPEDIALSFGHLLAVSAPTLNSEEEYIRELCALIGKPSMIEQRAREANSAVVTTHTGKGWLQQLDSLYRELASCEHSVREIPTEEFQFTEIEREILRMNEVVRSDVPLLADWVWLGRDYLSAVEVLRAGLVSYRLRDSSLTSFLHYRKWLGAVVRAVGPSDDT